ncbi:MAG: hypothetical protein LBB20_00660 [Puniceicoccales bacterium]|jgi:uncharacterized alkaline shock family protein YloU|nr:hypothetical protein [Puniceicoccales bacterium]
MLGDFYNWLLTQLQTDGVIYCLVTSRYFLWFIGLMAVYVLIKIALRSAKKTILCLLDNESGKVFIKKSVLKETIREACESLGMQSRPRIDIFCKSKKINIKISFNIPSDQKLPEVSTRLQKHLHIVLADDIGIKNIDKIDIVITGINRSNIPDIEDIEKT